MTLRMTGLLCFVAFLPFLALGLPTNPVNFETYPVKLTVFNELTNEKTPFSSSVIEGGVLFGVLNNLQKSNNGFSFTYSIHDDFGIFLESVNRVAGSNEDQTYWELLTESEGNLIRLEIGVGCYQPKKDEHIVLRFTTWKK
ncbi:transcobalamin-1-like [Triplophysa rosa]|uniref:Transcobalamin like n=1 Tax=Triplophysa rosa TaxID=992332 RepID=A0A9W7X2J6_TRIRA|nr:transcobalamin-1-like [Triplophysa rosa]KAI7812843.1 transcobalamin like precursor [Triplophysa rosa]